MRVLPTPDFIKLNYFSKNWETAEPDVPELFMLRATAGCFFLIFNGFSNSEFKKQSAIKLVTVAFAPIEALFVLFVWALTLEIRKVE